MSDEEKGFKVKDRRSFTQDGKPLEPEEAGGEDEARSARDSMEKAAEEYSRQEKEGPCSDQPPLPEVNFSTFIFSLSTSALLHLGELPDPNTRQRCQNLLLAKQTIDILAMLKAKTGGNLDEEEQNLLDNLLYELRMKFVAARKNA